MDMFSKIEASWIAGTNAEIDTGDGRKIKIREGIDQIVAKAKEIEMSRSKTKTITNNRDINNELESK